MQAQILRTYCVYEQFQAIPTIVTLKRKTNFPYPAEEKDSCHFFSMLVIHCLRPRGHASRIEAPGNLHTTAARRPRFLHRQPKQLRRRTVCRNIRQHGKAMPFDQ
jgi:hypothetical protein